MGINRFRSMFTAWYRSCQISSCLGHLHQLIWAKICGNKVVKLQSFSGNWYEVSQEREGKGTALIHVSEMKYYRSIKVFRHQSLTQHRHAYPNGSEFTLLLFPLYLLLHGWKMSSCWSLGITCPGSLSTRDAFRCVCRSAPFLTHRSIMLGHSLMAWNPTWNSNKHNNWVL